jgi:LCP family protein required for cell wall assembly
MVLAGTVLVASGAFYGWYRYLNGNLHRVSGITSSGGAVASDGAENVLLVGSDSRSGQGDSFAQAPTDQTQVVGARSDTVILAHLAPGHEEATLVSLPRDSWVEIPSYTDSKGVSHPAHQDKLNAAFSLGGAALLVRTVQNLTGIHIDHYAEIDFAGFQKMVSALGGVQVCLSQPAHDVQTGLNLTAGVHELNGVQALEFVRQRYGLPLGDIDRIKRQQQFLASMMRKAISAGTLTNPIKLNSFLTALTGSITVDSGMGFSDMKTLALKLKDLGAGNVVLTTMPLSGFATEDGQDVDIVDTTKSATLFDSLRSDTPASAAAVAATPSVTPLTVAVGQVHVQVFNGAGVKGLAAKASADLSKLGYQIVGAPANRGTGASATLIEYGPTQAEAARTLAASLPGATLQPEASLGADIQLVLGSSYTTAVAPGTAPAAASAASSSPGVATGTTTAASAGCTD